MSSTKFILLTICLIICNGQITFDSILKKLDRSGKMKVMAVAGADNESILECVRKAKDMKIVDSVLVGDKKKVLEMAAHLNVDIKDFEIVDLKEEREIARYAVKLVHDGKADFYAKGSIETKVVLQAALDKKIGLRTGKPLTYVSIFEDKDTNELLFMADPAIRPYPTLEDKAAIIRNTVDIAHAVGVPNPKVAVIAAVEVVNPKMPETVEADQLRKMNENGEITGCIVDGPLSVDLSIDPVAARLKKTMNRKIKGDADVLIFPDIHAGNAAYKIYTHVVRWKSGNIVTGTSAPCVLSSRSDTAETKLNSVILASIYADYLKAQKK